MATFSPGMKPSPTSPCSATARSASRTSRWCQRSAVLFGDAVNQMAQQVTADRPGEEHLPVHRRGDCSVLPDRDDNAGERLR